VELEEIRGNDIKHLAEAFPGLDDSYVDAQTGEIVLYILKDKARSIEARTTRAMEILSTSVRIKEITSRVVLQ